MLAVVAAVAFLALAVCLLNLVLTLGVLRRLREHTELISNLSATGEPLAPMLAEGEIAGTFDAVATTGERVSRDLLSGLTLVGAFSPHCPACAERLPAFVDFAATFTGGRDQVIAVLAGEETETTTYRAQLEPVARVVIEPAIGGEICTALEFRAFPAFGILDEAGKVVSNGVTLDAPMAASAKV